MPRALFITYYFPPSGGPGVQRVLKWVKYVREYGWEPVVLTVADGEYPERDESLFAEIPDGITVHRTRAWSPYRMYAKLTGKSQDEAVSVGFLDQRTPGLREKVARWIRANIFLPDARVGWVPFAISRGTEIVERGSIDAIVSSGPPHSTHLVARSLHRKAPVAWVADFRDPWTDIDYYSELPMTRWARRIDRALEQLVLDSATRITSVSDAWCRLLGSKTGTAAGLIRNGFDPSDFEDVEPAAGEGFLISHVGNLLPARNPEGLWRVLGRLRRSGRLPQLRLRFVGNVDVSVRTSLEQVGLDEVTEYVPYVPHEKALAYMMGCTILLLTMNRSGGPEFDGHIPGKLYEYMASGRPILGVGAETAEAAEILRETQSGEMIEFGDESGMERLVKNCYDRWSAGKPLTGSARESLTRFTRQFQARQLANLLSQLIDERDPVSYT